VLLGMVCISCTPPLGECTTSTALPLPAAKTAKELGTTSIGAWSKPVNGLRGRIVVRQEQWVEKTIALGTFLQLENTTGNPLSIRWKGGMENNELTYHVELDKGVSLSPERGAFITGSGIHFPPNVEITLKAREKKLLQLTPFPGYLHLGGVAFLGFGAGADYLIPSNTHRAQLQMKLNVPRAKETSWSGKIVFPHVSLPLSQPKSVGYLRHRQSLAPRKLRVTVKYPTQLKSDNVTMKDLQNALPAECWIVDPNFPASYSSIAQNSLRNARLRPYPSTLFVRRYASVDEFPVAPLTPLSSISAQWVQNEEGLWTRDYLLVPYSPDAPRVRRPDLKKLQQQLTQTFGKEWTVAVFDGGALEKQIMGREDMFTIVAKHRTASVGSHTNKEGKEPFAFVIRAVPRDTTHDPKFPTLKREQYWLGDDNQYRYLLKNYWNHSDGLVSIKTKSRKLLGIASSGDTFSWDYPVIVVTATYPGAGPSKTSRVVCDILMPAIRGVDGMRQIGSTANGDTGQVMVVFMLGTDPETARMRVQNRISGIAAKLPKAVRDRGVQVKAHIPQQLKNTK
jgi:hypothetical protein